jgi:hypothetical protein
METLCRLSYWGERGRHYTLHPRYVKSVSRPHNPPARQPTTTLKRGHHVPAVTPARQPTTTLKRGHHVPAVTPARQPTTTPAAAPPGGPRPTGDNA